MAFQTSLSGLNAAQANLSVTGNNIANASTNGFKKSRAEFADIFAVSFGGASSTAIGGGVRVANVSQQFSQGNIEFTENALDLAISGEGFYVLRNPDGTMQYSRAGAFGVDREGYVVNSFGQHLQYYPVDANGDVVDTTVISDGSRDLFLDTSINPANATTTIDLNLNVDAAVPGIPAVLDVTDPATYNFSTSTTIYDSLGVTHTSTLYFKRASLTTEMTPTGSLDVNDPAAPNPAPVPLSLSDSTGVVWDAQLRFEQIGGAGSNSWRVYVEPNPAGANPMVAAGGELTATSGPVALPLTGALDLPNFDPSGGTTPQALPDTLSVDLSQINITNSGSVSSVAVLSADYVHSGPANTWYATMNIDGTNYDTEIVEFNPDGTLRNGPDFDFVDNSGGFLPLNANPMANLVVDLSGSTQYAGSSSVNSLVQDGYAQGTLSGIDIDQKGVVFARYTNGQSALLGAVALAKFRNPQGLQPVGDNNWADTFEAGDRVGGQAGTGTFGQIQSGALEASNVDISKQLVNMIVAQRDFQANAKMISTEDTITQTIINIR